MKFCFAIMLYLKFSIATLFAQPYFLNGTNKSLKFSIVQMSSNKNGMWFSTKIILKITEPKVDSLRNWDKNTLFKILENFDNENLDWYANALLYDITNRDATLIYAVTMETIHSKPFFEYDNSIINLWREKFKVLEIQRWSEFINSLPAVLSVRSF